MTRFVLTYFEQREKYLYSFLDPFFLHSDRIYSVNLLFKSECGELRTKKTPNTATLHVVFIIEQFYVCHNEFGYLHM